MKFYRMALQNGKQILLVELTDPTTLEEIASLTNGYTGDDIGAFNGSFGQHDAPVVGSWAIPAEWLNDGGRVYLANATPTNQAVVMDQNGLTVTIKGAGSTQGNAGLSSTELWLMIGAAVLAVAAVS